MEIIFQRINLKDCLRKVLTLLLHVIHLLIKIRLILILPKTQGTDFKSGKNLYGTVKLAKSSDTDKCKNGKEVNARDLFFAVKKNWI